MDHLYRHAHDTLQTRVHIEDALRTCSRLAACLTVVFQRGRGELATVATQVAAMEVACDRLRLIVGSELVDLEKVEVVARLQAQVRNAREGQHV